MDEKRKVGSVKFYSTEKGYGFIYSQGQPDAFFHVTEVDDPLPPAVGTPVSFVLETDPRSGKLCAKNVRLEHGAVVSERTKKPSLTLDGFPCVRGNGISGFVIKESFGNVCVGRGWFADTFGSANEAREKLIEYARDKGANAIINYVWHNDRKRKEGFFGWYVVNQFWAEGEAVLLVPK